MYRQVVRKKLAKGLQNAGKSHAIGMLFAIRYGIIGHMP